MSPLLEALSRADNEITLAINGWSSPFGDAFWTLISGKAVWIPLYVAIVILLFAKVGWRRALVALLAIGLTVLACDQGSDFVKDWADRLRPCHNQGLLDRGLRVLESKGSLFGFFSAHSANAMGIAVSSIHFLRLATGKILFHLYSVFICLWSILVSVSRIFVGKHFFGDVLVGVIVGVLVGWCVWRLLRPLALRIDK